MAGAEEVEEVEVGRLRRAALALVRAAWVLVVGLGALLALWLVRFGESSTLGWILSSATHLALLGAWLALAVAVFARDRALGLAAGALVVAQLAIAWPLLPWPGGSSARPHLTLRSSNAFVSNDDPDAYAAELLDGAGDVIAITEFTPEVADALDRAGVDERYPHQQLDPVQGTVGTAIYSTVPFEPVDDVPAALETEVTAVDVQVPDEGAIRVFVVHAFPPGGDDPGGWSRSLRELDDLLAATDGPWVAIGDYNATYDHRVYRDLVDGGREDAHLATGRGLARSWPAAGRLPALFLIDRAIVGPGLAATATAERTLPGSDHRALDVAVAIEPSA